MILAAVALLVAASSCSDKATVNGSLAGAPDSKVVFKRLSGGSFNVLDTVKTDASGAYSYKMKIAQGQPEFVYVFHDDTRVASLILQSGENVKVVSDLTGKYTVEGSVMNREYHLTGTNAYPEKDCTLVCIKLSDMENHRAVTYPRFQIGGRWFYDIVENNARREEEKRTGTEG